MERSRKGLALILRDKDSQLLGKCFILAFKSFSHSPKTQASTSLPSPSQSTPLLSWAPPQAALFPTQFVTLLSTPRDTEEISHLRDQADWCHSHSHQTVPSTPTSRAGSNPRASNTQCLQTRASWGLQGQKDHTQDVHTPPVASSPPRPHTDTHTVVPHTPCCYKQQTFSGYLLPAKDH